eukprot:TRINITY_DN11352_c4_g1_i1.p1 TRINITY_DN11352_c4_g1~~TRINITY_DN11352_c4_g1_i1.p1  ORF type:complete len:163 (+),score=9.23 TRINITY_DN11352_c4_g1_i1:36-491(+)
MAESNNVVESNNAVEPAAVSPQILEGQIVQPAVVQGALVQTSTPAYQAQPVAIGHQTGGVVSVAPVGDKFISMENGGLRVGGRMIPRFVLMGVGVVFFNFCVVCYFLADMAQTGFYEESGEMKTKVYMMGGLVVFSFVTVGLRARRYLNLS